MTGALHTPGPWTLTPGDSVIEVGAYGEHIATVSAVPYWKRFTKTDEANARLIAAAPEMLAALQLVAHDVRSGSLPTNIQNAIIAAIAKATGAL